MTTTLPSPAVLGARAFATLAGLNRFSDEPGKLTRLYLSPSHRQGAEYVKGAMEVAGLTTFIDAAGSVQGRREGASLGLPAVLIGSHIDTVRDGGRFDGNLGVVAGILAAQAIRDAGIILPFALEVIAFGDEETVRFPTSLSTSSALIGHYDPAWLDSRDAEGVVLRDALVAFGGDPAGIAALARKPGSVKAYLEVHIEQGPVLEVENEAVGIVTAINAQSRAAVRVNGEAGHAGTVPMKLRKDALTAAAEMALALEEIAGSHDQAVGTVGVFRPDPGATNVVPGAVDFTIDYRAPIGATVAAMERQIQQRFGEIAARRGVGLTITPYSREDATPMAAELQEALATGIARTGSNLSARRLPSGAGHDAMAMARLCPSAMLFVRCEKGISHSPLENMTELDAGIAIRVLIETILELARREG
ncbi:Allantoate deiminase [Bosea sp. 62]|uniref:allantoate amidohydrolase n=1 Tax=unclassified Bosea (in: a-proteobacteria) TaxID=2653178 RepID=UPI0012567A08|nr:MULTISPECIES: allantoate amidohydrolase [unclassified Bosea (in: a-proteobacteria)]CAD5286728.1 Allantoate deiminase [Bosea sp. 21B]CAD5289229.1 Allantoate deiminase [Bosea sp. 46]CAD5301218.1 Allantoate deiminase [Bosea sp. 7B]VVT60537.1 Allantoate deiminase [Bosea sp. EC-HK365B]VXB04018.1 Allantoate deiminase [Bosea sp. 62]